MCMLCITLKEIDRRRTYINGFGTVILLAIDNVVCSTLIPKSIPWENSLSNLADKDKTQPISTLIGQTFSQTFLFVG